MIQNIRPEPAHDLRDLIRAALRDQSVSGRNLRIELDDRAVVLRGAVRSYYQKQVAQESVRRVAAGAAIRNELEVID